MDESIGDVRIWAVTVVGAYVATGLAVVVAAVSVVCASRGSMDPAFDSFAAWIVVCVLTSCTLLGTAQVGALSMVRHRPWIVGVLGTISFWSVAAGGALALTLLVGGRDASGFGGVLLPSQGIGGLAFWTAAGWLDGRERAAWPAAFLGAAVSGFVAVGLVANLVFG